VPELIPLVYHFNFNTRWAAQISLVQLTGQNFGNDANAWGDWYNANRAELGTDLPPFDPMPVDWAFGLNEGQLQFHADPANQDRLDAQWFQRQNY